MALQLNPYAKQTLLLGIRNSLFLSTNNTTVLRVFPASIPMSTNGFSASSTGHLVSFPLVTTSMVVIDQMMRYNQTINANAVATGTAAWWGIYSVASNGSLSARIVCDSVGLNGSTAALILGNLSTTNGSAVSMLDLTINIA
jgi:hypothetical protein